MSKLKWVKQLTRENTLLDRGLRILAYRDAVKEIGKATIANCLITGHGTVSSLYYLPNDYKKQQSIIRREFKGRNITKMSAEMIKFLEQGYSWAKTISNEKLTKKEFLNYYKNFLKHHAHARGCVLYGYWGEPPITAALKKSLKNKTSEKKLDKTISILSLPQVTKSKILRELHHTPNNLAKEKEQVLKQLNLNKKTLELINILSWLTFFYEVGERVADYLYKQFLAHLKKIIKNKAELEELTWYDSVTLEKYLEGEKLPNRELEQRKEFYILKMIKGKWKVLASLKAKRYYQLYLKEKEIAPSIKEIKGTVACPGKVRGRVKIIITQEDQKKMNKGNILISPMTTPRLMTAIKKATAIVTDEGGMTAHAAIVSRELNIPCIVGTKIATKVLKDGDKVEVDANKGVVRKIK